MGEAKEEEDPESGCGQALLRFIGSPNPVSPGVASVSRDVTGWAGAQQSQLQGSAAGFSKEGLFSFFIFELTKIGLSGAEMPSSTYE